jgi:hypothetical protein
MAIIKNPDGSIFVGIPVKQEKLTASPAPPEEKPKKTAPKKKAKTK